MTKMHFQRPILHNYLEIDVPFLVSSGSLLDFKSRSTLKDKDFFLPDSLLEDLVASETMEASFLTLRSMISSQDEATNCMTFICGEIFHSTEEVRRLR